MTGRDATATATATATALAALEARWGAAAPRRLGSITEGALAPTLLPTVPPDPTGRVIPTGFAALDALIGRGGLPRETSVVLGGDASSGRTTIALRLVAEAQRTGAVVAWLDLSRSLDPVEAVARGVDLRWLVVLAPEGPDDGLAMAGVLLQGRAVDLLVVDLPDGAGAWEGAPRASATRAAARSSATRPPSPAVRVGRLGALARRSGATLVVLEPPSLPSSLRGAVDEATGLRLAARRRGWIRLGRDVVGQRTELAVERSHLGPPGRRTELRILYAEGGDRDACLRRPELLAEPDHPAHLAGPSGVHRPRTIDDAPSPPPLVPSPPSTRPDLRVVPEPGRPRRAAVGGRDRPRHGSGGGRDGGPARDEPRERASARP